MPMKPQSRQWPFRNLHQFVTELERIGELKRVKVEVDPVLEVSEIVQRVVRQGGPAVLFERPRGSDFPLVMNLFGSMKRIELALGRHPEEIGEELIRTVQDLNPPSLKGLWRARRLLWRSLFMRPRVVSSAPVQEIVHAPDLTQLPILKCWPRDGGRFITFGTVLTQDPVSGRRNLAIYRLHVYSKDMTGMHWQSMKGGRGHYYEAERRGQPLEVAVVLGGDPLLMLCSVLPLPEDVDEIAFAGFLRGAATPMVRGRTINMLVPAEAEFILEGIVPPGERRLEGPFGDHFGHYSEAAEFPVFRIRCITRRRHALYPATVVGKPPQEDKYMGLAAGAMIGPLIKLVNPNIVDLHAYVGAGFHNLLGVSLKERHPKEVLKTALSLLGTGQLSLTKVMVLVGEDVNPASFTALLRELWFRFNPEEHMLLLPIAPLDTLDFTSFTMHVGSKLIMDATGEFVTRDEPPRAVGDLRALDARIRTYKLLDGGFLVIGVEREPREVLAGLLKRRDLGPVKFIVAVSADVDVEDEENLLWGIFTRFDPARDMMFETMRFIGARPVYGGRIAIDATWKPGYPLPLEMDEEIINKVNRRWAEYWQDARE
ncbi:MAG: UbiD family decarboxylase [Acidobacteria bacterium]|nr:MAG: UbiD family decarboxylase [Acidobacteriota bacterium]